jgi:membrane-associated phospholipid phosphatase
MTGVDYGLYKLVNGLSGAGAADGFFKVAATDFVVVLVAAVALAFLIPWRAHRRERRAGAVLATAAAGLSLAIAQPIAHAVDRLRPYLAHPAHAHLLVARSHDPSFPSDHATGAFALAAGLWLYDRTLGTILLVLAALVSFSRVYVGTHYPGDVVAGALLGAVVALALFLVPATRRLLERVAAVAGAAWDAAVGALARRAAPSR